jgi:hypothetical protein
MSSEVVSSGINNYTGSMPSDDVDQVLDVIDLIDEISDLGDLASAGAQGITGGAIAIATEVGATYIEQKTEDAMQLGGADDLIKKFNSFASTFTSLHGYTYTVKVKDKFCVRCRRPCDEKGKYDIRERTYECKPSDIGIEITTNPKPGAFDYDVWGKKYSTPQITTQDIKKCHQKAIEAHP